MARTAKTATLAKKVRTKKVLVKKPALRRRGRTVASPDKKTAAAPTMKRPRRRPVTVIPVVQAPEPGVPPRPVKTAPWVVHVEPELGLRIREMAETRGVDASTLVRMALHNLVQKSGIYGLQDKLTFGKYAGETVETVIRCDPRYLRWCVRSIDRFALDFEARDLLDAIERGVRSSGLDPY